LDHGRDLELDVDRLVQHVGHVHLHPWILLAIDQLVIDQKELIRVDRAHGEVIVGVLFGVEVKAAQPAFIKEQGDDLLDVGAQRMVPEIDQHHGSLAEPGSHEIGHSPIAQIRMVKGGLKELVFDE